jgi:hypothetical protein
MDSIEYWQSVLNKLDKKSFKAINKIKPVVHYLGAPKFYLNNDESYIRARVFCLDHPELGCQTINTSIVISINDDGCFETLNTFYKSKPFGESPLSANVEEMLCAA